MAQQGQDCSIPCNAREMQTALQQRRFGDETFGRLPVIGVALLLVLASPALALFAPVVTAVVIAGWGLAGIGVIVGQSWLGAATPARDAMPVELLRLVDINEPRMHPPRTTAIRHRATALTLDQPNFDSYATRVLQDLREATGEAWRCKCRRRRFPLPLSF